MKRRPVITAASLAALAWTALELYFGFVAVEYSPNDDARDRAGAVEIAAKLVRCTVGTSPPATERLAAELRVFAAHAKRAGDDTWPRRCDGFVHALETSRLSPIYSWDANRLSLDLRHNGIEVLGELLPALLVATRHLDLTALDDVPLPPGFDDREPLLSGALAFFSEPRVDVLGPGPVSVIANGRLCTFVELFDSLRCAFPDEGSLAGVAATSKGPPAVIIADPHGDEEVPFQVRQDGRLLFETRAAVLSAHVAPDGLTVLSGGVWGRDGAAEEPRKWSARFVSDGQVVQRSELEADEALLVHPWLLTVEAEQLFVRAAPTATSPLGAPRRIEAVEEGYYMWRHMAACVTERAAFVPRMTHDGRSQLAMLGRDYARSVALTGVASSGIIGCRGDTVRWLSVGAPGIRDTRCTKGRCEERNMDADAIAVAPVGEKVAVLTETAGQIDLRVAAWDNLAEAEARVVSRAKEDEHVAVTGFSRGSAAVFMVSVGHVTRALVVHEDGSATPVRPAPP